MERRGKRILEKALGTFGYKKLINELRKNVYTQSDHEDLAKHLDLLHFYVEVTKLELVGFREIPEVLLLRWAEDNNVMVDKQVLAGLFRSDEPRTKNISEKILKIFHCRRTRNMRRVAGMFEYANLPCRALLGCCYSQTVSPSSSSSTSSSA